MSKISKSFILILLAGSILAACTSQPITSPLPLPAQGGQSLCTPAWRCGDDAE